MAKDKEAQKPKERMAVLKVEVELKGKLIEAMKAEHLTAYDLNEHEIVLEPGEDNVKVWIGKKKATKKAKE